MTNKTHRSTRGWLMVLLLLCGGIGIYSYVQGPAILDYPLWQGEQEHLLIKMPSVPPKAPVCLATDALSEVESSFAIDNSSWLNYRSRPTTSSIALLEPQAGVRLLAPQADSQDQEFSDGKLKPISRKRFRGFHQDNGSICIAAHQRIDRYAASFLPKHHCH